MGDETASVRVPRRRPKRGVVSVATDWGAQSLPALVRATLPGVDLGDWIRANRETLDVLAHQAGAVLLRGFAVADADAFQAVMSVLSDRVLDYTERSSPRSEVTTNIFTSTDHPADQPIVLHNEQSYTLNWPLRIVFFCDIPPAQGGRTPLADSRKVLARLPDELVERFDRVGVLYQRNYLPGIGLSWQQAFQTTERSDVQTHCLRAGIDWEWLGGNHLRTRQVRPAIRVHPATGERTWFNHALFFHASSLPTEVRQGLAAALDEHDLPTNTYYGDGSPIEQHTLDALRASYAAETTAFEWQQGDVLVVENMLAAHGREPYRKPRRILAGMCDPISSVAPVAAGSPVKSVSR